MANTEHKNVYADEYDTVMVPGRFSGGDTAATKVAGGRWSIAHASTGNYNLTFSHQYKELLGVQLTLASDTPADIDDVEVTAGTLSAGVLPLFVSSGTGAKAAADLTTTQYVDFVAFFRISGN